MVVLVSLIVLLRRLLISTVLRIVYPYISFQNDFYTCFTCFVKLYSVYIQLCACANLRRCALPSLYECSKDGIVFSSPPYTVQSS